MSFLSALIEDILCHNDITKLRQYKRYTCMCLYIGIGRQCCYMKACSHSAKLASFRSKANKVILQFPASAKKYKI